MTCIQSLSTTLPDVPFELVLVDTNASPQVKEAIRNVGGDVRTIQCQEDDAFSPYEVGARHADKALLLFLHDDTILLPGFLSPLLVAMGLDPAAAAVQPGVITLSDSSDVPPFDPILLAATVDKGIGNCGLVVPDASPTVGTTCTLIRADAFLAVGGFGSATGHDDPEQHLGQRLLSAGWRIEQVPRSRVVHRSLCVARVYESASGTPRRGRLLEPSRPADDYAADIAEARPSQHRVLVLARVGDSSVHRHWCVPRPERSFDVALEYFGEEAGRYANDADFYTHRSSAAYPGTVKYSGIASWLEEHSDLVDSYDYVFLPDDDLVCDAQTLGQLFDVAAAFKLSLAQPALTHHSHFSHRLTLQDQGSMLRFTNFVEVMAPLFSREALRLCRPTFTLSRSSWGLDMLWPVLLGNPTRGIAIIDQSPVYHSRPVGKGTLYQSLTEDPRVEMSSLLSRFNIPQPYEPRVLETVQLMGGSPVVRPLLTGS